MKKRNFLLLIMCLCILSVSSFTNYTSDYGIAPCEHLHDNPLEF